MKVEVASNAKHEQTCEGKPPGPPPTRLGMWVSWWLLLTGCATHVIPPAHPARPVTVYLTDYGRHSSLLLPAERGGYDEYAFGDWQFFAKGDARTIVGLRALLGSPQSTLGRRFLDLPHEQVTAEDVEAKRLMSFQASSDRVDALRITLNGIFRRSSIDPCYSDYSKLYHVTDPERYWVFNNCNHVTARWLRRLGCEVRGSAIFSNFVVEPRRHSNQDQPNQPPVR